MAKAHVFPIGFFSPIPTKGQADTGKTSGIKGRHLQKAIYDSEILCRDCEHNILGPLDDYAIKILRDRQGLFKEVSTPEVQGKKLLIFQGINKERLQQFFASLLWRVSVSSQLELKEISIGQFYESRIADDLRSNHPIGYLDVVVTLLVNPLHCAFFVPQAIRIIPKDTTRDTQEVDGWSLDLPFISIVLSLDARPHPGREYLSISPDLTGESQAILSSTSVHPEAAAYSFMAIEMHSDPKTLAKLEGVARKLLEDA